VIVTCLLVSILSVSGSVKQKLVIENPNTGNVTTYYYDSLSALEADLKNVEKEIVILDKECTNGEL